MKIGILGGGQLGKMLFMPAAKLDMDIYFMDQMLYGPVARISNHYRVGDITDYDDVMRFGAEMDVISIEIEKVNTRALYDLEKSGKVVFPQPHIIECIQDKGLQKQFYKDQQLPTSPFKSYTNIEELQADIDNGFRTFPFVQKLSKDGYDGRGVRVIRTSADMPTAFKAPFIVEEMVTIKKEIGIVTCRDRDGHMILYDPVEMVFHDEANILLYQLAPARINQALAEKAKKIAQKTAEAYGIVGLLAIELFLTDDDKILINEVAPRPHNSGHHTIEATISSQYENQMRVLSGLPLGAPNTIIPSLLMNILGDQGHIGPVVYKGLDKVIGINGVHVHLYGKKDTKPFRKMGHINIVGKNMDTLIKNYKYINRTLQIITN